MILYLIVNNYRYGESMKICHVMKILSIRVTFTVTFRIVLTINKKLSLLKR